MKTINHILVPVDFSKLAVNSYHYALRLAGELSASVHLLHCLPVTSVVPGHGPVVLDMRPTLHQQAKTQIIAFAAEGKAAVHRQVTRMPEVYTSVSASGLGEGVFQHQKDQDTDLIVIGTHGVQEGWDRIFSTNAAFLVDKVQSSILILPATVEFQPLKTVCFATNLGKTDLVGARRLSNILATFQPKIDLLHVRLPHREQPPGLLDSFRRTFEQPRNGVKSTFTNVFGPVATDGIFPYLKDHFHDLLVMVKSDRKWWDRLFFSSYTKESAMITNIPLLILGE
jgi:nucleotide-binding universal stress UspA family protein